MSIEQTQDQVEHEQNVDNNTFLRSFVLGIPMQALREREIATDDTSGPEECQ